jgi:hypothetical protein
VKGEPAVVLASLFVAAVMLLVVIGVLALAIALDPVP